MQSRSIFLAVAVAAAGLFVLYSCEKPQPGGPPGQQPPGDAGAGAGEKSAAGTVTPPGQTTTGKTLQRLEKDKKLSGESKSPAAPVFSSHLRLAVLFDEGLHGCQGAVNPFAAAGNVELVAGGRHGKALRLAGHEPLPEGPRRTWEKSAVIFDGQNIPAQKGTISFYFRSASDRNRWADGQRYWLAVLAPRVGVWGNTYGEEGTGLAVVKERDNTIALRVYQFYDNRLGHAFNRGHEIAKPDAVPLKISAAELAPDKWVSVRFAWDKDLGKVWLSVNGKTISGKCAFRPGGFLCLILGSPPKVRYTNEIGFRGDLDELQVDDRTLGQSPQTGLNLPAPLPVMAPPPRKIEPARLLAGTPHAEVESLARTHLLRVIESQKHGGWVFSVAYPSRLRFLSSKVVIPYPDNFFGGSKAQNSAGGALWLAAAYDVLGNREYLEAAERTAKTLMRIQQPAGCWPYGAYFPAGGKGYKLYGSKNRPPFEDHVQSHPTLLLLYLHLLTGKQEYLDAARKGAAFILSGQNPNGSWSHQYDLQQKCGMNYGHKNGGEHNDYSTSDQMLTMLLVYRRTGEVKYLASYLKAARWVASSFIDGAGAKGWAQQYDADNQPIWARHFEPAAVSLSEGIPAVPLTLISAYRLTGDKKYLEPVDKWFAWLDANKKPGGWYLYYDIKSGRPIAAAYRKIEFLDTRPPRKGEVRDWGVGTVRVAWKALKRDGSETKVYVPGPEAARQEFEKNRSLVAKFVKDFDREVGSWSYPHGPSGLSFSPCRWRIHRFLWAILNARLRAGQLPWDHRLAKLTLADWAKAHSVLMPDHVLYARLSAAELARARKLLAGEKGEE